MPTCRRSCRWACPSCETAVSEGWFGLAVLPDLFPVSFPGVQTKRDSFLVDVDLDRLKTRISDYFDPDISHEEIARRYPSAMKSSSGFVVRDARAVRDALLARGGPDESGFVRHAYRPFDNRWLYWEAEHGLLGRPVPDYRPHVFEGNVWLSAAQHLRRDASEPQTCFAEHLASLHLIERTAIMFPAWLSDNDIGNDDSRNPGARPPDHAAHRTGSDGDGPRNPGVGPPAHAAGHVGSDGDGAPRNLGSSLPDRTARGIGNDGDGPRNPEARPPAPAARRIGSDDAGPRRHPNLSSAARRYLESLGLSVEDLFHHVLAVLHDPAYREANAGAATHGVAAHPAPRLACAWERRSWERRSWERRVGGRGRPVRNGPKVWGRRPATRQSRHLAHPCHSRESGNPGVGGHGRPTR